MADWRPLPGPLAASSCGSGPRVVLVHGFTQTSESWKPIADDLVARGAEVLLVDLPGHGGSSEVSADLAHTADLIARTCGPATYVGYSLGGRVCLHLAIRHPRSVRGLVLLGATPGLVDADERAARRAADEALASRIEADGVDAFLEEWIALPLFGALEPTPRDRAARQANTPAGLADSLRRCGTGTQQPLWEHLATMPMPVLAMAGARDTKFLAIAAKIAAAVPDGHFRSIPDADHAAHLQRPDAVLAELIEFLDDELGDDRSSALRR